MAVVVTQLVVDASGAKTGVAEFESAMKKAKATALDTGDATSKSFDRVQAQWTNSLAKTDPLIKASIAQQKEMSRQQEINSNAVKLGITTQAAADAQITKLAASFVGATKATTELANAHKGLDAQGQAAFHTIRSGVEQLAMGVPLTQALTSQINHLTFAASGQGGLAGAFGQVGSVVKNLISPATVAIGTLAALGAAAAYVALEYDKVQVSSRRAIGGAGARTGTTADDLNAFTKQNSSPLGMSADEARALGEGLTRTGAITVSQVHNMNEAVVGFANQTKTSVDAAAKEFEKFGADPVKALKALEDQFGPVDEHLKNLVEYQSLGIDKTRAFNTVLDAFSDKLKEAAENTTLLEKGQRLLQTGYGAGGGLPARGPESQLAAIEARIAEQGNGAARSQGSQDALQTQRADLLNKISADSVKQITAEVNALNTAEARAAEQTAAIAKAWGDVSLPVALALNTMQQQVAVASAVTGQEQMATQAAIEFANAKLAGKTDTEAQLLASEKLAVSEAAATTAVEKQISSLKDANAMIRAQQNGTEAATAAAIAYKNAVASGADSSSAAALSTQTLANATLQAENAADATAAAYQRTADSAAAAAYAIEHAANIARASTFDSAPSSDIATFNGGGNQSQGGGAIADMNMYSIGSNLPSTSKLVNNAASTGSIDAALSALKGSNTNYDAKLGLQAYGFAPDATLNSLFHLGSQSDISSAVSQLYDLKLGQAGNDNTAKAGVLNEELGYYQGQPKTLETLSKISQLQQSIQQLTDSTNTLNGTNQATNELLSPYYTQDPRTSHIGFRSQGMASGGEFVVPGGYSANDNMLGTIPLASGEIVSVRRPGQQGSSGQSITVNNHITVGSGANVDQLKRTLFQNTQNMVRQLRAAS